MAPTATMAISCVAHSLTLARPAATFAYTTPAGRANAPTKLRRSLGGVPSSTMRRITHPAGDNLSQILNVLGIDLRSHADFAVSSMHVFTNIHGHSHSHTHTHIHVYMNLNSVRLSEQGQKGSSVGIFYVRNIHDAASCRAPLSSRSRRGG